MVMNADVLVKSSVQIVIGVAAILAITLIAGAQSFREPAVSPPNNDPTVARPLHDGSTAQVKTGGLGVLGNFTIGSVAVGTELPKFFQIDAVNSNGIVPGTSGYLVSECNESSETGRMFYDVNTTFLYLCNGAGWLRFVPSPL